MTTTLQGVRVLVLDGDERAALAVVRSLSRAGCWTLVAASRERSLAAASRNARGVALRANSLADPLLYAAEIGALVEAHSIEVLIPISDASLEATLKYRTEISSRVVLPFAELDVYQSASDKILVHELALKVGLGIEESVVINHATDWLPREEKFYPGVLKPHRSIIGDTAKKRSKVEFVRNRLDCARKLEAFTRDAYPVLLQRRVQGPGEGYFAARWKGRTVARFAHRRLREKPPAGGVSVYRESIELDREFGKQCDALLDELAWTGVAMVECKRDTERGGWRVIEVNGRFWGSLQLAIDAGVDFPALLVAAALNRKIEPVPQWRQGVRLRWEWGDVDHILIRLLHSTSTLSLQNESAGRLRAFLDFLDFRPRRDRLECLRVDDPMPFLRETIDRLRFGR